MRFCMIFFLLISVCSYAQLPHSTLNGTILDASSNEPLAYCNIAIKYQSKGFITNELGQFQLKAHLKRDTLIISYIGYTTRKIPAHFFVKNKVLKLKPQSINLKELVVAENEKELYDAIYNCRKKLRRVGKDNAKGYLQIESQTAEQPIEMLQTYYNVATENGTIQALNLKNGRVGLAPISDQFFFSLGTSTAISRLSLTNRNQYFPWNPLQLTRGRLKKRYRITRLSSFSNEAIYHIAFEPRKEETDYFAGEIWIDKATFDILKIELNCKNASQHPFEPIWEQDEIESIDFNIVQTFQSSSTQNRLSHVNFSYAVNYLQYRKAEAAKLLKIGTSGLLFLFEYDTQYLEPLFEFEPTVNDYLKISTFPFNPHFWAENEGLVFTDKQQQQVEYFKTKGTLLNYRDNLFSGQTPLFLWSNAVWSASDRLTYDKTFMYQNTNTQKVMAVGQLLDFKVNLFVDINQFADTLQYFTKATFDIKNSFYNIPKTKLTDCFINIYFDIAEIHRRQLQAILDSKTHTIAEAEEALSNSKKKLERRLNQYLIEVSEGLNYIALEKWNDLVDKELGVDNLAYFKLR